MSRALFPHFDNLRGQGDRISSAADSSSLDAPDSKTPYVDHSYGHSWSFTPKRGAAVYGITDNFSPSPIDHLAYGRFLRVLFRRVPIIDVSSAADLARFVAQIASADDSIGLRWRGQNKEYYLARSEDELLRLFGDISVREPSLVPSAARSKLEFAEVFPSWAAILDLFMSEIAGAYRSEENVTAEITNHRSSYNYRLWAFATAQHYGLPSVGLDITTDFWTAVIFALHRFTIDKETSITSFIRVDESAEPVLYAMAGFENDLFDDKDLAPEVLQGDRPKAQQAHFFGTGWGKGINKAAERIFIAFRLLNHTAWTLPKNVSELFPTPENDSLLAFLLATRKRFPTLADEARLSSVYYVP
jgi:hypothetical protein